MNPVSIPTSAPPMLVIAYGMKNGVIFLNPFSTRFLTPSWKTVSPPMPLPTITPQRVLSSLSKGSEPMPMPASMRAFLEETRA